MLKKKRNQSEIVPKNSKKGRNRPKEVKTPNNRRTPQYYARTGGVLSQTPFQSKNQTMERNDSLVSIKIFNGESQADVDKRTPNCPKKVINGLKRDKSVPKRDTQAKKLNLGMVKNLTGLEAMRRRRGSVGATCSQFQLRDSEGIQNAATDPTRRLTCGQSRNRVGESKKQNLSKNRQFSHWFSAVGDLDGGVVGQKGRVRVSTDRAIMGTRAFEKGSVRAGSKDRGVRGRVSDFRVGIFSQF